MNKKNHWEARDMFIDEEYVPKNKKKLREEKQRKAKRNEKNAFRSKSFDPDDYVDRYGDDE